MKVALGHDGAPTQFYTENLITEEKLAECPVRTMLRAREHHPARMREYDRYVETLYPAYQRGHLLVAGGISDQPARYLDYLNALDAMDTRVQMTYDAKQREMNGGGEA